MICLSSLLRLIKVMIRLSNGPFGYYYLLIAKIKRFFSLHRQAFSIHQYQMIQNCRTAQLNWRRFGVSVRGSSIIVFEPQAGNQK